VKQAIGRVTRVSPVAWVALLALWNLLFRASSRMQGLNKVLFCVVTSSLIILMLTFEYIRICEIEIEEAGKFG